MFQRFTRSLSQHSRRHFSADGVKTIGVVGAGQMGMGIALVAANVAKRNVIVMDSDKASLERGTAFADKLLAKDVKKGKLSEEDKASALSRISTVSDLGGLSETDFVVEAITENFDAKKAVFEGLKTVLRPGAILASNTSSISITKLAAASDRPELFCGMHFMNPVPVMKLVEIIPGLGTTPETKATVIEMAEAMGKTTATSKDIPGFIANRILMPYLNEAILALQEGMGSVEDIDKTMKLGTGVPMGPLTLADFVGLDTVLYICEVMRKDLGDDKYAPAPLLRVYVDAGWLGKKSGRGFYDYSK